MIKDEVMTLLAGRELDMLIAEKIMGLRVRREAKSFFEYEWFAGDKDLSIPGASLQDLFGYPDGYVVFPAGYGYAWGKIHNYSTDIKDAWEFVEMISRRFLWFEIGIEHLPNGYDTQGWEVTFYNNPDYSDRILIRANTAPLALCRAALFIVESNLGSNELDEQ